MFLSPKNPKYTKSFSRKKQATFKKKTNKMIFGDFCLIASESGKITNFQMESLRRFLRRFLKKKAKIFFRIFPNMPITKKPNEVRLGRGKGPLKYWACFVNKGDCLLEIKGANSLLAKKILLDAKIKLPIKCFFHNKFNR
tara:strand:+ start:260 stop:679 length:420 start_codon:yes stop_codon:yes gene_type:complete